MNIAHDLLTKHSTHTSRVHVCVASKAKMKQNKSFFSGFISLFFGQCKNGQRMVHVYRA